MAQRDTYSGGRRDKHRKLATLRAREQREQEDQFRKMEMLQKSPSARDHSSLQIEINKLTARITIAEANIAELTEAPVPRRDDFSWLLALLAILAALASMTIAKLYL